MRKKYFIVLLIGVAIIFANFCNAKEKENNLKNSFHLYLVYSNDFYNGLKASDNSKQAVNVFEKYIKRLNTIFKDLKQLYKQNKEFFDTLNPEKIPQDFIEFKSYVKKLYDSLPDLATCIEKFENDKDFLKEYNKYKEFLKRLE